MRATAAIVMAMLSTACFDPVVPAECKGAVCGSIQDPPEGGGGTTGANAGVGGMPMGGGGVGGGTGGNDGGMGGIGGGGGANALAITIINPIDAGTYPHGSNIDFIAETTGGMPANDQIRWQISSQGGLFGVGYTHTKRIDFVDTHTLTVAVMEGDTPIATDTIVFNTN